MRWEVCEWREPNIEDGAAIHNTQQKHQWRISLKTSKAGGAVRECGGGGSELCGCCPGGHQSKQQHLGEGWSLIIAVFSSQVVTNPINNILERAGRSSLQSSQPGEEVPLRGGPGLSMEGLEGGGGAEETRKGGTEAFGQLDSKVKVLSLSCTRIFCSFCNCDQCLKRARLS